VPSAVVRTKVQAWRVVDVGPMDAYAIEGQKSLIGQVREAYDQGSPRSAVSHLIVVQRTAFIPKGHMFEFRTGCGGSERTGGERSVLREPRAA
jgi:hypothetical protein